MKMTLRILIYKSEKYMHINIMYESTQSVQRGTKTYSKQYKESPLSYGIREGSNTGMRAVPQWLVPFRSAEMLIQHSVKRRT